LHAHVCANALFLGHIAVLHTSMKPIVTNRVEWSVSQSVCHTSEPYKMAELIINAVWVEGLSGPSKPCIRRGSHPHGKEQF